MSDEKTHDWMTDSQRECAQMLVDLFGGFHHLHRPIRPCGKGIKYVTHQTLATFDSDVLTRAVVMAHERSIRFEVAPSSPRDLQITLHKRPLRKGNIYERHPGPVDLVESMGFLV